MWGRGWSWVICLAVHFHSVIGRPSSCRVLALRRDFWSTSLAIVVIATDVDPVGCITSLRGACRLPPVIVSCAGSH
jgi:hypothetical protein